MKGAAFLLSLAAVRVSPVTIGRRAWPNSPPVLVAPYERIQPKRPVTKFWVRGSLGVVNIRAAVSNSTNSPRNMKPT